MKTSCLGLWLTGVAILLTGRAAQAAVRPANLFQEGTVLQCGMAVPIWGQADPGEIVTVRFGGQSRVVTAGADGKWLVKLAAMPANSTPADLSVAGSNTVTLKNVVVGEVWLATGQSNMQFTLDGVTNHEQEIATADYPLVRCFTVTPEGSLTPVEDVKGAWKVCTPQTVGKFSAVAYFFARELQTTLKVPVGIIDSSYGGTPAEAWTSRDAMNTVPALKNLAEQQTAAAESAPSDMARFPAALSAWEEKYGVKDGINEGFRNGWAAVEADTTDWKTANAAFTWESALGAKSGGVFWLRKEINLPESAAGKGFDLKFGRLSEQYHTVYFNGEEVGDMGHAPPNFYTGDRSANIPGRLVRAGRNVVAIRFVSHTEKGGLSASGKTLNLPVTDRNAVSDEWQIKAEKQFPPLPAGALDSRPRFSMPVMQYTSTTLFNEMIHPLIPGAFRGVIWYQGEANASAQGAGAYYRQLLSLMIGDWRARWQEGNFPFYLVQLANYAEVDRSHRMNPWALLRESQTWISRTLPESGLAVSIDLGSATTIHPTDKQDVGKRLAFIALAKNYGRKDVPYMSPLYNDCIVEGDRIRVRFEAGSGKLMVGEKQGLDPVREVPDGKLTWFAIAGKDRKFVWAEARIDGDGVVVSSAEVPRPVAVRYAWAQNPQGCNLYNRAGLPASPFRTDEWP